MEEADDADLVVERVAALDLGKAGLEACVRVPNPQRPGRRMQERLRHDHRTTVGDGGLVAALAGAAGGDGIHQHLLEGRVLPRSSPPAIRY
jgi:hypothetical protein